MPDTSIETISFGAIMLRLAFLALLIGLNAFFVMMEYSIVVSRRSRIDQMSADGNRGAKTVQRWLTVPKERERLIAASQLGVTIVSLALGDQGEKTFDLILAPLFANPQLAAILGASIHVLPLLLSLVIVSSFHVVFGEQVPKVAALRSAERVAVWLSLPMRVFTFVARPLIWLLDHAASGVLRAFGLNSSDSHSVLYSVEDLKQIMRESEEGGVIAEQEHEMLTAIFDIRDLVTRQVMVPRTEITMVDADAPISELIRHAIESPHTKFPAYEKNSDHVIGVVYTKELVRLLAESGGKVDEGQKVRSLIREVLFVPESLPVENLLARFRSRHQQMAIVLDEFGGTSGMITVEDIVEELVGELHDEFERAELPAIERLNDGRTLVEGLMQIADFNDQFQTHLVDDNYDTIGGWVMGQLERIPVMGDTVPVDGIELRVEAMDGMRISRLSITPVKPPAPPAPDVEKSAT